MSSPALPSDGPAGVSCAHTTAEFYACANGSRFMGCCDSDPCPTGCSNAELSPVYFDVSAHAQFPDVSCSSGSQFYKCGNSQAFSFVGCCRSNPCTNDGICSGEDLTPAVIERPEQLPLFLDPRHTIIRPLPSVTASVAVATGLPAGGYERPSELRIGPSDARIAIGISGTLIIALCVALTTWIIYRKLVLSQRVFRNLRYERDAQDVSVSTKDYVQVGADKREASWELGEIFRLGTKTLYVLLATSVIIFGLCGFLAFLWFGDRTNTTWNNIMINNWATRSVSLSALVLRTAVDFQAAIASAILAALLLECTVGTHVYHLASLSPMRTCNTNPWTFAQFMIEEIWHSAKRHRRYYKEGSIAICLLITTSLVQFSSTILLSDLQPGPLAGYESSSEVRPAFAYLNTSKKIPRDAAWTTNPPFYPMFAEYYEPASQFKKGVASTGVLLRTFLPYTTAESRQTLSTYTGNAMVMDASVSCQAPTINGLNNVTGHYTQLNGTAMLTEDNTPLPGILEFPFDCAIAGPGIITLCQIKPKYSPFFNYSSSQFEGSTSYITVFLVIQPTRVGLEEWLDIDLGVKPTSFSLCFAPWDGAILDVSLSSTQNRTEPQLQWWETFKTSDVLNYLIPSTSGPSRQTLVMQKPSSLRGDLPPQSERPFIQSDASGGSALEARLNYPLPGGWSILLTQDPLLLVLRSFSNRTSQVIAADPALGAIFNDALAANHSVAWAFSSLITVLSMTNYYSQQPAFDRIDNVTVSFYSNVLYPHNYVGFVLLMWALFAHFVIMAVLVVLFVTKTRLTLLGNAWSAFAQMAESQELREYVVGASLREDGKVLERLKEMQSGELRARVVRRGDGARVVVE